MVAIFFANKMEFYELLEFELIFIKIHLEITADLSEQVMAKRVQSAHVDARAAPYWGLSRSSPRFGGTATGDEPSAFYKGSLGAPLADFITLGAALRIRSMTMEEEWSDAVGDALVESWGARRPRLRWMLARPSFTALLRLAVLCSHVFAFSEFETVLERLQVVAVGGEVLLIALQLFQCCLQNVHCYDPKKSATFAKVT